MSKRTRMIVDISMIILLPMLMAYSLIGEKFHEIVGSLMLILFIAHHILNRGWIKGVFKGKYNGRRVFQTGVNLLLLLFMILQPISGILMSKHLYPFIRIPGASAYARLIHLASAYWGFVLMSVHAGTHLALLLKKLKEKSRNGWMAVITIITAISLYGIYAFIKRGLAGYMFLKTIFAFFDFSEPRIFFFMDYMAIMVLFASIGDVVIRWLSKERAPSPEGNRNS